MSMSSRRAARNELRTAKAFGVARVHRQRGQSVQDIATVRLPSGAELVCECKLRARLPALIKSALQQAHAYDPDAIPVVELAEHGGQAVVALALADFRRLVGLASVEAPAQPSLLARRVA